MSGTSSRLSSLSDPVSEQSNTSNQFVGTKLYRTDHLSSAKIFIDRLKADLWPAHVHSFVSNLTQNLILESVLAFSPEPQTTSSANDGNTLSTATTALRDSATLLAGEVKKYALSQEVMWMRFNTKVLEVFQHEALSECVDERFLITVGPTSPTNHWLSMPKPDVMFGIAVQDADVEVSFTDAVLKELKGLHGLEPFASPTATNMAFPCVIYEAKPDTGVLMAAENQAAHGAAKALAMLKTLTDSYQSLPGAQATPQLPVVVLCSVGPIWEAFVAFELRPQEIKSRTSPTTGCAIPTARDGTHLVRIWGGFVDTPEVMFQLQLLLQRVLQWILNTWRPTMLGMLDALRARP